jgi:CRISPR-associated protein Cas2
MMILVNYDVSTSDENGPGRLRKVARACLNYGQRVQNSLFECNIAPDQWVALRESLVTICDPEKDSLRFYFLGSNWQNKVEHFGTKRPIDLEGTLLI